MNSSTILGVAMLAPFALSAQVRDTAPVLLPQVSVTATRAPLVTRRLPVTVTVFDRASLREAGVTQLSDVVRLLPGATVLSNGSYGSQTSLFLRGGESDYVQVLVDGVPMNEPGGFYNFGPLTIDNIDRIEVMRGPGSLLYGSDAVSGVIQVFTRTGKGEARTNALAGGGSHGARRYELGASGGAGGLRGLGWSISGASHRTDGILAYNNKYRNDVGSAAVSWHGERADMLISTRYMKHEFHYPTNSAGEVVDTNAFNGDRRIIGAVDGGVRVKPWLEFRGRAALSRSKPRTRDLKDDAADENSLTSDATVRRNVYEGRAIASLPKGHVLTLSAERARDEENSSSHSESSFGPFDSQLDAERTNTALVAQLLGNIGARYTYTVGVRRDDNSAFGEFVSGRIGGAVVLSRATTVRASFGNAFKAPTFFENFATGFTVGNPNLTPELARTVELGAQYVSPRGRMSLGATAFAQRFTDLIQYFGAAEMGQPNYRNLAEASADGIELEGVARLVAGTTARASYTYLRTKVTDAGADEGESATFVDGDRLLRRPTHFATFELQEKMPGGASGTVTATYTGERDDRDFNQFPAVPITMKAFTRVDFALVQPFGSGGLSVVARVENAFNKAYQQTFGFASPGRTYFFGVRFGN